jgi:hypothetical protein
MFSGHNNNPVIGTFDDAAQGLGPSPRSSNSLFGDIQRPIRVQLPVPYGMSECISELHVIGRMQAEMEKSVTRVQLVADGSSHPHLRPQISSPEAVDVASNLENHESKFRCVHLKAEAVDTVSNHEIHESKFRCVHLKAEAVDNATNHEIRESKFPFVNLKAEAPGAAVRQPKQDPHMHEFTPKLSGFAESPQPQLMHSTLKMLSSAASPAIDYLESPVPHELSAISHVALTRMKIAGLETESRSNLSQHVAPIEKRMLFSTPAPSTKREQHLKNVNGSNPNSFGNLLQQDAFNPLKFNSSTSRSLAADAGASILETSSTAAFTPDMGQTDQTPAAIKIPNQAAIKLQLKMQTMDAKNREIDSMLAQFLKRQTEVQNISRMQGVVKVDESTLQQSSPPAAKNSPKMALTAPSSASLASPKAKMGISSMFREQSK